MAQKGRSLNCQKYTTLGETYEEVQQQADEARRKVQVMEDTIDITMKRLGHTPGLKKEVFFFIQINYFCKSGDGVYYPSELALAAYSIQDGIKKVYHTAVNPGNLPTGYSFKAQTHTEDTHRMPLPPNAMGERDSTLIVEKLMAFAALNALDASGTMPPFYTMPINMEYTEKILEMWAIDAGMENDFFRIYRLDYLFQGLILLALKPEAERQLKNGVVDTGFVDIKETEQILLMDQFRYSSKISCDYHEEADNVGHCSRSFVTRWGWMLSSHLCKNLDVKMIPGQHKPNGSVLAKTVVRADGQNITIYGNPENFKEAGYTASVDTSVSRKPVRYQNSAVAAAPGSVWKQPSTQATDTIVRKAPWKKPESRQATTMAKEIAPSMFVPELRDFPVMNGRSQTEIKRGRGPKTSRRSPREKVTEEVLEENPISALPELKENLLLKLGELEKESTKLSAGTEPNLAQIEPPDKVNQSVSPKPTKKLPAKPEEKEIKPAKSSSAKPKVAATPMDWPLNVNAPIFKPRKVAVNACD